MNELDDLYGDDGNHEEAKEDSRAQDEKMTDQNSDDSGDDGQEDDDESDSDVEFVITTKPGQRAEAPTTKAQPYAGIKITKPGTTQATAASAAPPKKEPVAKLPDVDVDAIAEMDGKSILEVDLESLENKPWRQPGADITEYFNYGFDEFTWTAYCQKQTSLREEYAPDKVMQNMMGAMDTGMMGGMGPMGGMPGMGPGMMMPPMDPAMMQQMYGGMPMDFMQGPPGNFGNPSPMPQQPQQQYNRNGSSNSNGQRQSNSPMPEQHQQREDIPLGVPNAPRGPAQSRNNFRPRGGGGGNRW